MAGVSNALGRDWEPDIEPEFKAWPKISRQPVWMRVTEKIDGTNACVIVMDERVYAQSRTRLITPGKHTDNFGFAAWVRENAEELLELGPGYHYGEWWGRGIQRTYDLEERRFSLFGHWYDETVPSCCHRVPELYRGEPLTFSDTAAMSASGYGSFAAPGYHKPEGWIVEYHSGRSVLRQKVIINECKGGKA